ARWQYRWSRAPLPALSLIRLAVRAAAAAKHHPRILLLSHTGHECRGVLEAVAIGGEDLREEVDVAAKGDHLIVIALQDCLPLRRGHRPLCEVGALVGFESGPV